MPFERIYDPATEQHNALNAAADQTCTRELMAGFYADCLRASRGREKSLGVDFALVNRAVLARWPKGLEWIKRRAWKAVQNA